MNATLRPRALRTIVALAAAPLALGACGGDDDEATDPTDAVTTTQAGAAETTLDTTAAVEPTMAPDTAVATDETMAPGTTAATGSTSPASTVDVTTPAADGSVTYTSDAGDYTAVFPGEPTVQTQPQALPDGNTVDIVLAGYVLEDGFIATARGQYPDGYVLDVPVALQGAQDQALANVSGTLLSSQDVTLQGRPGREFSASITSGDETGTLLQRVYLDDLVIYQQIFTGAGEATFADPELAPFFESFAFATD